MGKLRPQMAWGYSKLPTKLAPGLLPLFFALSETKLLLRRLLEKGWLLGQFDSALCREGARPAARPEEGLAGQAEGGMEGCSARGSAVSLLRPVPAGSVSWEVCCLISLMQL